MTCYFSYKQLDYIISNLCFNFNKYVLWNKICYFEIIQIIDGHSAATSVRMSMIYTNTSDVPYIEFFFQIFILYLVMNSV